LAIFLRTCQNRGKIKTIIKKRLAIFCVLAIFSVSCKRYDKSIIAIASDDLITECKKDSSWSIGRKYGQKTIRITGKILFISYPKEGHLFFDKFSLTFGKLDDNGHLSNREVYIDCSFDNEDDLKYDLYEGKQITLVGYFDRYSDFLFRLKHCKINELARK
jgi:hypothetical protein